MVRLGAWVKGNFQMRWVIYLCMFAAVSLPMIWRISFVEHGSPMVRQIFDYVDGLPPGAHVLLSYNYDPATEPEVQPMADAFTRHLCLKRARIFYVTLWPTGPAVVDKTLRTVMAREFPDYQYGQDYINFGFKAGNEGVIVVAMTDLKQIWSTDAHNIRTTDTRRLPIMEGVDDLRDIDLIIDCSAGYPGLHEWVQYAVVPGGPPIIAGSVAIQCPEMYPYVPHQCLGLLAGLKGAAEYEQLLLERYPQMDRWECRVALRRMGPQTVAHLTIILFILVGNAIHLVERRRGRRTS
jgi:hypothetical protein